MCILNSQQRQHKRSQMVQNIKEVNITRNQGQVLCINCMLLFLKNYTRNECNAISDSNRRSRNADSSAAGDQPEQTKSTRRHSSSKENGGTDSPKKSRSSRRHHRKDSADGSKHGRIPLDSAAGSESPARDLPDIPKKSRRKKSKEADPSGTIPGSRSSKSKGTSSSTAAAPASDPGSEGAAQSSINSESIVS